MYRMLGLIKRGFVMGSVLFFVCWTNAKYFQAHSNGNCVGPGEFHGFCQNLIECTPFLNLLVLQKSRPKPRIIEFLKKTHCGFEKKNPIVCCPLSSKDNKEFRGNVLKKVEQFLRSWCESDWPLDKILGGTSATIYEFPWMALIQYKTRNGLEFRCGGTLISRRYVLTAAHCVSNLKNTWPVSVRLGEYDLRSEKDCEANSECTDFVKDYDIEEIIVHPQYLKAELRNDIALIKLSKAVNFVKSIRPSCLPVESTYSENIFVNKKVVVAGWGTTDSGTTSQVLRKVTLPLVSNKECSKIYSQKIFITESQICAGGERGKDSCTGDSGGPLHFVTLDSSARPLYIQHGIVSFGPRHCGTQGVPGVYTKVSHYLSWIITNLANDFSSEFFFSFYNS